MRWIWCWDRGGTPLPNVAFGHLNTDKCHLRLAAINCKGIRGVNAVGAMYDIHTNVYESWSILYHLCKQIVNSFSAFTNFQFTFLIGAAHNFSILLISLNITTGTGGRDKFQLKTFAALCVAINYSKWFLFSFTLSLFLPCFFLSSIKFSDWIVKVFIFSIVIWQKYKIF